MDTIRRFEMALGREVRWREDTASTGTTGDRLFRVSPNAMQEANAFYDPDLRALLFGYFEASLDDARPSLPGQVVFTCLSHDIIVHETTHAILDGIRFGKGGNLEPFVSVGIGLPLTGTTTYRSPDFEQICVVCVQLKGQHLIRNAEVPSDPSSLGHFLRVVRLSHQEFFSGLMLNQAFKNSVACSTNSSGQAFIPPSTVRFAPVM